MKYSELYDDTADLIESEGWIQDTSYVKGRGYCAIGALDSVTQRAVYSMAGPTAGSYHLFTKLRDRLLDLVNEGLDEDTAYADIPDWNDNLSPETGKQTVLDMLRAAAKKYYDVHVEEKLEVGA